MRWNKKGALELSITAIVVLIIAITVLGLAIFFIKNLFAGGTEIFTGQLAGIKEELRRNIEESGELVVFSAGTEFKVKRGKAQDFYIGIRNTATEKLCFLITMNCVTPFTPGASCDPNRPGEKVTVGGLTLPGEEPPIGENWFPRLLSKFEINPGDVEVVPVTLQVGGGARADTYQMEANIYQGTGDCSNPGFPDPTSPWQSKRFYIQLS